MYTITIYKYRRHQILKLNVVLRLAYWLVKLLIGAVRKCTQGSIVIPWLKSSGFVAELLNWLDRKVTDMKKKTLVFFVFVSYFISYTCLIPKSYGHTMGVKTRTPLVN